MNDELSFDVAIGVSETRMASVCIAQTRLATPIKGRRLPVVARVPPEQYFLGAAYNFRLNSEGKTYLWNAQRPQTIEGDGVAVFKLNWADAAHG